MTRGGRAYIPALRYTFLNRLYDRLSVWAFRNTTFGKAVEALFNELDVKQAHEVLDLGCGPGRLAIKVKTAVSTCRMTAIDSDPTMLAIATSNAERAGVHIDFISQDMTRLSLPKAYDRIYSTFVFHHLTPEEKVRSIEAIGRHLVPNGFFVVVDFCRSQTLWDHLKFLSVEWIDGLQRTSSHRKGWLEKNLPQFFTKVVKVFEISTCLGRVGVFRCSSFGYHT